MSESFVIWMGVNALVTLFIILGSIWIGRDD